MKISQSMIMVKSQKLILINFCKKKKKCIWKNDKETNYL